MVRVSDAAVVVTVTLAPPTTVNVSVLVSAAIVSCPDTATFEKAFWLFLQQQ